MATVHDAAYKVFRSFGMTIKGRHVDNAADLDAALAASFAHTGPSLIEVETTSTPSGMFDE